MTAHLIVERAGLLDTLQDRGRIGFQALGMPTAGAMDRIALRLVNALAGNTEDLAAIEIGVMGPTLRVEADGVRLAVVGLVALELMGAPEAPPKPLEANRSHLLRRGQRLRVGMVEGARTAYLAVEGGFAVAPFMGSLATYTRAGIGGVEGRKLQDGDMLPLAQAAAREREERKLGAPFDYGSGPIRVVPGPQADHFSDAGHAAFLGSDYVVSKEADRMGIRFEGPAIAHSEKGPDIVSDGIAPGAIQVPGAGLPIVLLADRQTVGGYAKIATVISADLPRLGRMLPGHKVRFMAVTVAEAEALRREQDRRLAQAIAGLQPAMPEGGIDLSALYERNLIDGVVWA
ncbi:biotin-dependent carboxyltransferase [Vineibacter terrae]|uniref:Biotin-dependent carboxyltransferase n=1 Tax=Vineibacter terrae TaxID=2586908 RepID=A0A5C8PNN4_9HYPH|nr:biotin-dependent carboxyltransferase family protein [Vineibacter terrae]TXL75207.1 biotin-dependent carboxyltransferase [Vineibacter terrae]